jgi:CRISPR-associated exonuclease Cas4
VEDAYGIRPSFGILQYRDQAFTVDYTTDLEQDLLVVMAEMREDFQAENIGRSHSDAGRCLTCGFHQRCRESLA